MTTTYLASKVELGTHGYCPEHDEYVEVIEHEGRRVLVNVIPVDTGIIIIDDTNDE